MIREILNRLIEVDKQFIEGKIGLEALLEERSKCAEELDVTEAVKEDLSLEIDEFKTLDAKVEELLYKNAAAVRRFQKTERTPRHLNELK